MSFLRGAWRFLIGVKDALALRQRQEEKGRIDSRKTIRKSLSYGGVPMEVILRRRHRDCFLRLAEEADLQLKGP